MEGGMGAKEEEEEGGMFRGQKKEKGGVGGV